MADDLRLGLNLGYWQRNADDATEVVQAAERLGYESVWTAEAYGSDAFTPLAWYGARTSRIKLGTSVAQLSARPPVTTAMTAMTLDHLTAGGCCSASAPRARRSSRAGMASRSPRRSPAPASTSRSCAGCGGGRSR